MDIKVYLIASVGNFTGNTTLFCNLICLLFLTLAAAEFTIYMWYKYCPKYLTILALRILILSAAVYHRGKNHQFETV